MKKGTHRLQGFIAGLLMVLLLLPLETALASPDATITRTISVAYRNIQIMVNGERITPRDAQGRIVEPFIFNGTTFLPVRAVSEALGMTVDWDGPTSTVYIGGRPTGPTLPPQPTPPSQPQGGLFLQEVPPYEQTNMHTLNNINMGGVRFATATANGGTVARPSQFHNLGGQFSTLSGTIGRIDGSARHNGIITFIGDGRTLESFDIGADDLPREIAVNVAEGQINLLYPGIGKSESRNATHRPKGHDFNP